jgi:hypothetical protein
MYLHILKSVYSSLLLFGQRFGICIQLYTLCFHGVLRQLLAISQPMVSLQEQVCDLPCNINPADYITNCS